MNSAKAMIREVIEAQPEDASYEEILRELAFDRMVARGLADALGGKVVGNDEMLRRIKLWSN